MNTITDDELSGLPPLPNHTILGPAGTGSYFNGHTDAAMIAWGRAVLALAEQRHAAKTFTHDSVTIGDLHIKAMGRLITAAEILAIEVALADAQPSYKSSSPADDDESDPVTLWAEIHRLRAAVAGPDGFASWQDAATNERIRRVRAEARIAELEAQAAQPAQVASLADIDVPNTFKLAGESDEQWIDRITGGKPAKVVVPTRADGWVMLDKRGLVHQERWWKWDFFGGIETREGFTPADVDNACREWPGLAPFTVVPVFLAAAPKREGGA
jgi:hypothetical protein